MRPKARANNLIVLVEFLLKFTSNDVFQLFLDLLLNFAP